MMKTYQNPVDLLFEDLGKKKPKSFAVRQYKLYKLAAGKTAKSILIFPAVPGLHPSIFRKSAI